MSGKYPAVLRKRAESMIRLSKRLLNEGENDLAALNAEYAARLYVKSLLYRLSDEEWRGHNIRALLGLLSYVLDESGMGELSKEVMDFVRANRRILAELEEAYTRAVYGIFEYNREQAEALIKGANDPIEFIRDLERRVFGGLTDA